LAALLTALATLLAALAAALTSRFLLLLTGLLLSAALLSAALLSALPTLLLAALVLILIRHMHSLLREDSRNRQRASCEAGSFQQAGLKRSVDLQFLPDRIRGVAYLSDRLRKAFFGDAEFVRPILDLVWLTEVDPQAVLRAFVGEIVYHLKPPEMTTAKGPRPEVDARDGAGCRGRLGGIVLADPGASTSQRLPGVEVSCALMS
jgi:hypothetical protein